MPVKVLWDYTYYWGVLCQLFFQNRLTDRKAIARVGPQLSRARDLNAAVQKTLGAWGASGGREPIRSGGMLDQASLPWFAELNRGLRDELDDAAFTTRIEDGLRRLEDLAAEIEAMAANDRRADRAAIAPTALLFGMAA